MRILPAHLVNRIAAGEVVERPASVVKELVENALDAGATRIEVYAANGGRTLRIADNGSGMRAEDARLAFYNHATSKIQNEADLDAIETLGFRGEALASITAISRLICLTRTRDAETGIRVSFADDNPVEPVLADTGCAVGTVMEVSELFYNTPARLKFLKRPATEVGHIEEAVEMLALSHPAVRFTLSVNEKTTLQTTGSGDLRQAIDEVYDLKRHPAELVAVGQHDPDAGYHLTGYTSAPGVLKSNKRHLITFINGRSVRCHLVQKAIEAAYESLIPHGKYPMAVLHLTLPLDEVDVNVHPTKKEVRYANSQTVFTFIRSALKSALEAGGFHQTYFGAGLNADPAAESAEPGACGLPDIHHGRFSSRPGGESGMFAERPGGRPYTGGGQPLRPAIAAQNPGTQNVLELYRPLATPAASEDARPAGESNAPAIDAGGRKTYRVLAQLFNTYILLETAQGLMVVDQHIASERELFERIATAMLTDTPPSQTLLSALTLPVGAVEADLLREHQETFEKLGFTYALSADRQVTLTGYPLIYANRGANQDPQALFEDLLAQLAETGDASLAQHGGINLLIATLACHTAVRAGDTLTHLDMERVIEGWLTSRLPWTCPHGRPIAHTIDKEELNKFFHRPSLPVNSV